MTERDILSLMIPDSYHPAWSAFVREMQNNGTALNHSPQHGGFFKKGWDARQNQGAFTTSEITICEHGTKWCTGRGEKHACDVRTGR